MAVSISGDGAVTGVASVETPTTLSGLTIPTTGFGKVLQVVYGTTSTAKNTTSTSYVDTNLSATITPSSATSKVLVLAQQNVTLVRASTTHQSAAIALVRDSTQVYEIAGSNNTSYAGLAIRAGTGANGYTILSANVPLIYLDSPSATSPVTYKTQVKCDTNGGSVDVQYTSASSGIVLVEVGP